MMRIEFRGAPEDGDLRMYAEQRISSWVGHLERDLGVVTVCIAKETDSGPLRARCRMVTRPVPWTNVAVEETNVNRYAAIDRCAERLAGIIGLAMRARGARGAA